MEDHASGPPGFIRNLTGLGDSLLGALQERVELIAVEVQEEKYRLVRLIIWLAAAVFAGVMMMSFATLTLVYLFWEGSRLAALAGAAGFYAIMLAGVIVALRRHFTHQPKPFEATLDTIREDRACIRRQS